MGGQDDPPSIGWSRRFGALRVMPQLAVDEPLTPSLVPPLVAGVGVLAALLGAGAVVAAFAAGLWLGLLALAVVPFLVLGVIALARVGGELALAVLRMAEDVSVIAAQLPGLESSVHDVASEMPRFGFLKLLSNGR